MSNYIASDGVAMLETIGAVQSAAGLRIAGGPDSDLRFEETVAATYRDSANVLRESWPVNLSGTPELEAAFIELPTGE